MSKRDASEMLPNERFPGKKIKTEGPKPIVLTSPGMKTTDTRIVVFSQEFHVKSDALKMLSVYFKKFMDPINVEEKDRKPVTPGGFRYEWFWKADGEIAPGWFLSSDPQDRDSDITGFNGDPKLQEKCFHNILRALFCRQSVDVANVAELSILTTIAAYYLCLPAISNSLYATMINNPTLSRSIANDPCTALNCAYELHHQVLFREAMIHALGPWSSPRYEKLESAKLRTLGDILRAKMVNTLYNIDSQLRLIQANREVYGEISQRFLNSTLNNSFQSGAAGYEGNIQYPLYYRRLSSNSGINREKVPDNLAASIRRTLEPILKNNLRLDTMGVNSGIGSFRDAFLCFEILDEELPWDREQLDW